MATVLALSSSVARGHVGLQALVPVMQRLGHEVIALPTVMLSNHPGHAASAGFRVPADTLDRMLAALLDNGWLGDIAAVVTGYLPSAAHVAFAARMIEAVSARARERPLYFCDPVLGDLPHGLYIEEEAAAEIRAMLIPLADAITPNAFELGWLSGAGEIASPVLAVQAARTLTAPNVLATSVPDGERLANVLVGPEGARFCAVARRQNVPHGTGDVLTAQIAARSIGPSRRDGLSDALARHLGETVAATDMIIDNSAGLDELALIATADLWERPAPLPVTKIGPS